MCACTEPAGTGIGAVCVERRGQKCPKKMWNHTRWHSDTHLQIIYEQGTLLSYDSFRRGFFPLENQEHSLQPAAAAAATIVGHTRPGLASLYARLVGRTLEPFVHVLEFGLFS